MGLPATFNQITSIIQRGYRNAKLIEPGQEPNSEMLAEGMNRFNSLVSQLQMGGLKLWTNQDFVIPLIAGQGGIGNPYLLSGSGSGKQLRIPKNFSYVLIASSTSKRPIISLSRQEWTLLSPGAINGPISQIFVDPQIASLNVYTYLVPDSNEALNSLHVVIQNQITLGQQITDATPFPQEWTMALEWLFAQQVCQGQPQPVIDRCDMMAEKYRAEAEAWDTEDLETFFTPDTRVGYSNSSFL